MQSEMIEEGEEPEEPAQVTCVLCTLIPGKVRARCELVVAGQGSLLL